MVQRVLNVIKKQANVNACQASLERDVTSATETVVARLRIVSHVVNVLIFGQNI
jgi:hypothetical protein